MVAIIDKKIKLEKQQIICLFNYLQKCANKGFEHDNDFSKTNPIREILLQYSLATLMNKLFKKMFSNLMEQNGKKITIKINIAEETMLTIMFNRVVIIDAFEMVIQNEILSYLKPNNEIKMIRDL